MNALPVLFRRDPGKPIGHTSAGIGIVRRRPLRHRRPDILARLLRGPFLAAFDAGFDGEYVVGPCLAIRRAIALAHRGTR